MTSLSRRGLCAAALSLLGVSALAPASTLAQAAPEVPREPVLARNGMVTAQEKRAAQVGVDIMRKGGNAVDAAVAVGFAMAVTHPQAGNLGGGGFMLIHRADRNETVAIDYRETAPQAITRDSFLDANGEADPKKSRDSALAVGVPGTVEGLALAHERYGSGRFTLAELIAPAITLARNGIAVDDDLANSLPRFQARLARWPASARIFLNPDGGVLQPGQDLIQADLAASLNAIATDGPRAFYQGPVGEKIVAGVARGRGRDDDGRPRALPAYRSRAGARHLSRLRHRLDAAAVLGRGAC